MEPVILENPHWEVLTQNTRLAFQLLSGLDVIERFYLAGGTGLYLGNRFSIDLDFFSESPISLGLEERAAIHRALDDATLTVTHDKDGTFAATWKDVEISFFRLDQYPVVLSMAVLNKIRVASMKDLGAMKLAAIIGRGTRKAFVDLYFLLQQVSLEDLFQVAAVKFARVRTFAMNATRAMAYFEDAEGLPMPQMIDPTPWAQTKRFLENQAVQAGRRHLEDLWD